MCSRIGGVAASLVLASVLFAAPADVAVPDSGYEPTLAQVRSKTAGIRIPFLENTGQYDARVRYAAPTFAGTLFVTNAGELVYALRGPVTGGGNRTELDTSKLMRMRPARGPDVNFMETFVAT